MDSIKKRNIKWLIVIICCITFTLCMEHVFPNATKSFDTNIYNLVHQLASPTTTLIFRIITEFGNVFAFLGITVATVLLLKKKKYMILILGNLGLIALLNHILKSIFIRPRPLHIALIKETGYSFPSGHAMASVAFYGFLIYILWQTKQKRSVKIVVTALLSILVLFIGISRIYLGVHYASDILAGFSLSIIYLIIMTKLSANYL